jgi:hypothetical protein
MCKYLAILLVVAFPSFSWAAAIDYSGLTAAVDVAGVTTAILAVGALMIGINVVRWGVKKIANFF